MKKTILVLSMLTFIGFANASNLEFNLKCNKKQTVKLYYNKVSISFVQPEHPIDLQVMEYNVVSSVAQESSFTVFAVSETIPSMSLMLVLPVYGVNQIRAGNRNVEVPLLYTNSRVFPYVTPEPVLSDTVKLKCLLK